MATMSLYLFVAGGLALAFAFACHVAYTTILAQSGVALPRRALSPVAATVGGSATVTMGDSGSAPGTTSGAFAISATWVAAVLIGLSMLIRAFIVGRGPWGNMYEFCVAFAFGIIAGYLFLQRRYPIRSIAFLPLGVALFLVGYAATLPRDHRAARAGARQRAAADHPRGHGHDQLRHLRHQLRGRRGLPGAGPERPLRLAAIAQGARRGRLPGGHHRLPDLRHADHPGLLVGLDRLGPLLGLGPQGDRQRS